MLQFFNKVLNSLQISQRLYIFKSEYIGGLLNNLNKDVSFCRQQKAGIISPESIFKSFCTLYNENKIIMLREII